MTRLRVITLLMYLVLGTSAHAWIDTDRDGVPDKKDACADTPLGVIVMANGCIDPDLITQSQGSTEGTDEVTTASATEIALPIDTELEAANKAAEQCLVQQGDKAISCFERILQPIYFDFAKATILLTQRPALINVQRFINDNPNMSLSLVGHADSIGSEQFNQVLSLARAQSVKDILIERYQFSPDDISVQGMSNHQPAADNATEEGRQLNRRVEFIITAE